MIEFILKLAVQDAYKSSLTNAQEISKIHLTGQGC